eukprot:TRINITY_DN11462_c0_g1_i1.p1 TRINITY_DN11462_c0_g1~~TRINITY_DN11462_c0_g1_i1.p1  ORF type:complete len:320 (+),score=27.65 TRINITY_DN11462_c0_g1_i1:26-961(+)
MARLERKLDALERRLRAEIQEKHRELQDDLAAVRNRVENILSHLDLRSLSESEAARNYDGGRAKLPFTFDAVLPGSVPDSSEDYGNSGRAQRAREPGSAEHARDVVLPGRLGSVGPVDVRTTMVRSSLRQSVTSFIERGKAFSYTEPIPQEDSVWSIFLQQKGPSVTIPEVLIGLVLVLVVTFFQVYFQIMCESPAFQGTKNDALKQAASEWRSTYAHAFENANSAWVSLASRVCNNDGSLIVSTEHRDLLLDINNYLGLGSDAFEPSTMSPGTVLCLLCTSLWIWTILTSAMELADRVVAVFQLPRATVT